MKVTAKIGAIEFVGNEVRVALVKTGRSLPQVLDLQTRTAEYENNDDRVPAFARALNEALDALHSNPATFVLCVPCNKTVVRALDIPFKGIARVSKAVPFEIEPHLAFPLEELLLDFNVIREIEGVTEVLAVGARRTHLEEQLDILQMAGVEAELAGVDVAGLTSLWMATQKNSKGLRAVLHVRDDSSMLAIVHNKSLAYFRHLYFGALDLQTDPHRAAREVQNTLRAFLAKWRSGTQLNSLSLTGYSLTVDETEIFEETLNMPVSTMILMDRLKKSRHCQVEPSVNFWEAAVGVGFSAGGGGLLFNLMKDTQQIQGAIRAVVAHLMFSACLALLFLLGGAWYYHEGRLRNETVIKQGREELEHLEEAIDTMAAEGLGSDVQFSFYGDPTLLDLLKELSEKLPRGSFHINEIKVNPPEARGGWVNITGSADSAAEFNTAFDRLKESSMFRFTEDTNIRLQGDKITFRLRAFRPEDDIDEL
ncbi:MAG: pilus assembly protein PilM [Candidatus Hydrogenedens sp.]|jgi:hypothetical protein|nr:pilus assembly protein PilM [Candidatus Hydrogenedens sp.]